MAVDTSNTTLIIVGASLGGALLLAIVVGAVLVCKYRKEALQWKAKAEAQPTAREGVPSVNSLEIGTPNPAFIGDNPVTTNPLFSQAGMKFDQRPPSQLGMRRLSRDDIKHHDDVVLAKTDVRSLGGTFRPVDYYGGASEAEDPAPPRRQMETSNYSNHPKEDRYPSRYPRSTGPPEARQPSRYQGMNRANNPNPIANHPRSHTPVNRPPRMSRASMPAHYQKPEPVEAHRPRSQYGERRPARQQSQPREGRPEEGPPRRQSARRPQNPPNDRREFRGPYGPEDIY